MVKIEVKIEDNSKLVEEIAKQKKQQILYAIGLKWQKICTNIITVNGIVDTGRLRGSLSFITVNKKSSPISNTNNNKTKDFLDGSSGSDNDLIVGTNVEYAKKQELHNSKGAFLRPSLIDYKEVYEEIAEQIWKQ